MNRLLTIDEACSYATSLANKPVSASNIAYLIQYGRIDKFTDERGACVDSQQLKAYYAAYLERRQAEWSSKLGDDVNWALSFDTYSESETTKHVHRLHPYKGKYIPQLVEYFLDGHTDEFKREVYFHRGDIVLDTFCGSGTTLVQANELGINAVGVDISCFNAQISNCKIARYDIADFKKNFEEITRLLEAFEAKLGVLAFERELLDELGIYNNKHFPSPEFKRRLYQGEVDEKEYARAHEAEFLPRFYEIAACHNISLETSGDSFIDKWYFETVKKEIRYVNSLVDKLGDTRIKAMLQVVLSRTIRSCRATTHSDLATLVKPVCATYYCTKHKKICKPLFSILKWWKTYGRDTIARVGQFDKIRTDAAGCCFVGDSASIDLERAISDFGGELAAAYKARGIKGIFCSPPYVGLIDYHEQHAYELFGFERRDGEEIGSMAKGNTRSAQQKYIKDIAAVLINCKKYLARDYEVFIVANDKHNIYPTIAERAGMVIVEQFKRPVLNRTERDKQAYSEIIFRMKEAQE